MKKIIIVTIRYNDLIINQSSNIEMISFNNSFKKKFILSEISYLNQDIDWDDLYMDVIYFTIEVTDKYGFKDILYAFNFRIEDSNIIEGNIILNGIPIINYDANNYNQHVIDILTGWSKNVDLEFLSLNQEEKLAYNSCCRIWNGGTNELNE